MRLVGDPNGSSHPPEKRLDLLDTHLVNHSAAHEIFVSLGEIVTNEPSEKFLYMLEGN